MRYHFYPRSPCGERRLISDEVNANNVISIHALLAESDSKTPCVRLSIEVFLSTLSLRRATVLVWCFCGGAFDFYPRSPCGERLHYDNYNLHCVEISIHALLAESDLFRQNYECFEWIFLSTLSLRRATAKVHKTVGHFCAYETNFMGIASSC